MESSPSSAQAYSGGSTSEVALHPRLCSIELSHWGLEGWPIPNIQQIINRIGTLKPKVFGIIDFTAGYHQRPLHHDLQEYTAFITQYGLFEWNRVAMGLKGSGPFFQRSMANRVLAGYVRRICDIYIDDVLIHGPTDNVYLENTRKVLGSHSQPSKDKTRSKRG